MRLNIQEWTGSWVLVAGPGHEGDNALGGQVGGRGGGTRGTDVIRVRDTGLEHPSPVHGLPLSRKGELVNSFTRFRGSMCINPMAFSVPPAPCIKALCYRVSRVHPRRAHRTPYENCFGLPRTERSRYHHNGIFIGVHV